MIKQYFLIISFILIPLSIVSCSNDDTSSSPEAVIQASKVEIVSRGTNSLTVRWDTQENRAYHIYLSENPSLNSQNYNALEDVITHRSVSAPFEIGGLNKDTGYMILLLTENSVNTDQFSFSEAVGGNTLISDTEILASIDLDGITLSEEDTYYVSSFKSADKISDFSKRYKINQEIDGSHLVSVTNKRGEPILAAQKHPGQDAIKIDISSTAEFIVLQTPALAGLKFSDPKELSERIQSNDNFDAIKQRIAKKISRNSPCPLDPSCNTSAFRLADKLARDINFQDLVVE